jgi:hypothetical protein
MRDAMDGRCGAGLVAVGRQLAAWRRAHGGRGRRLPEAIWGAAVRLARQADPGAVARALRLNPETLARRLAWAGSGASPQREAGPAFVEVTPIPPSIAPGGCQVEVVAADGSRVSIQLGDPARVDLVALAGGLLRALR